MINLSVLCPSRPQSPCFRVINERSVITTLRESGGFRGSGLGEGQLIGSANQRSRYIAVEWLQSLPVGGRRLQYT